MTPGARLEIPQPQCSDSDAHNSYDWQSNLGANLADLTFASLAHDHAPFPKVSSTASTTMPWPSPRKSRRSCRGMNAV